MDELSEDDKLTVVARAQDREVLRPAVPRRRDVHRPARASTARARTPSAASRKILAGKCDDLPEQAFEMTGTIDDVRAKAAELAKRA